MSTTLEQNQYGFDRASRRTWQKRLLTTTQDQQYKYDALSQVSAAARGSLNLNATAISGIPAKAESWDYDPTGNWRGYHNAVAGATPLDQYRVHDRGNRLTQIEDNPHNMILDRAGRMLQMAPDASGNWDGKLELKWDAWSRITSVKSNGIEVGSYGYDGRHRRITREVDSTTLHSYYNDAWRPVEERKDAETTASISYLWGARHRDDLVRRDRATSGTSFDETRYILMDYFNPSAITDEMGAVKERYAFSAFGLRTIMNADYTERSSSECGMEFAFQGQFLDEESGLMNYGYRYYSPQLGRWTCKDPIGENGGLNLYATSFNQLINHVDFLGLESAYDSVLNAAAQEAFNLTQQSIIRPPPGVGIPFLREYCGLICCKDGNFKATTPHPGKWNGPAKDPSSRNWVSSTLAEDRSTPIVFGASPTCDPDMFSYTEKPVSCENELGAGWQRVAAYHSHPPGDTQFSKDDKAWSRKNKCPLGLGTCDTNGKPVTKEFSPDLNTNPTQSNPFFRK